jgi:hypothetical protein
MTSLPQLCSGSSGGLPLREGTITAGISGGSTALVPCVELHTCAAGSEAYQISFNELIDHERNTSQLIGLIVLNKTLRFLSNELSCLKRHRRHLIEIFKYSHAHVQPTDKSSLCILEPQSSGDDSIGLDYY